MNDRIIRWVKKSFLHTLLFWVALYLFILLLSNLLGAPACSLENTSAYSECAITVQLAILGYMFLFAVVLSFGAAIVIPWVYFFFVGYTGKSWRWYAAIPVVIGLVWLWNKGFLYF